MARTVVRPVQSRCSSPTRRADHTIGKAWRAAEAAAPANPIVRSLLPESATSPNIDAGDGRGDTSPYIFLTDDSCKATAPTPAVDGFLVTRLDRLVRRVLDSQISGRRVEPREGEAIRTVGRYDHGKCILPPDYPGQEQ